jgi:hypothetical protein
VAVVGDAVSVAVSVMSPLSAEVLAFCGRVRKQGVRAIRLRRDLFVAFLADMTDGKLTAPGWCFVVQTSHGPVQVTSKRGMQ